MPAVTYEYGATRAYQQQKQLNEELSRSPSAVGLKLVTSRRRVRNKAQMRSPAGARFTTDTAWFFMQETWTILSRTKET